MLTHQRLCGSQTENTIYKLLHSPSGEGQNVIFIGSLPPQICKAISYFQTLIAIFLLKQGFNDTDTQHTKPHFPEGNKLHY